MAECEELTSRIQLNKSLYSQFGIELSTGRQDQIDFTVNKCEKLLN